MTTQEMVTKLHQAADRVGDEAGTAEMDQLATAGAVFLRESNLSDEHGTPFEPDRAALGYGIMLGWLAANAS